MIIDIGPSQQMDHSLIHAFFLLAHVPEMSKTYVLWYLLLILPIRTFSATQQMHVKGQISEVLYL